jgi:thioredoxin reductase (NADPH)
MTKPAILSVDDDREVLAAIERDLKIQYRQRYRIIGAGSASEAVDTVQQLKKRGDSIALFLVDQRMPGMTGTQFLSEARKLYPEAARVLLTAYADTEAAISAINDVGAHHYLMKPWDPPEQRLYPVLDDLLAEWSSHARPAFEGIRILGSRWSPQSYTTRDFLARNQIPYQWVDLDVDAPSRELVKSIAGDPPKLPVVLFPDGTSLVAPSTSELAGKLGLYAAAARPFYDIAIIGGGPAGLANAVYAASEGLRTILIEQDAPGGQAGTSSLIENYLGFPAGVTGADLAQRAAAQARRFGTELVVGQAVASIRREDPYRILKLTGGHEISCHALVIATGMAVRRLDVPGLDQFLGAGAYYGAAMSEAALYRGADVAIVGGANSAGQGALFFSRYARSVKMIVRAGSLQPTMSRYLIDRIEATENISVITDSEVTGARGEGHLEQITVRRNPDGAEQTLDVAALFIFIGVAPRTEQFTGIVAMDDKGFILTGADVPRKGGQWTLDRDPLLFETSVPGIFAAGDVRANANRRIAAAVGEGSAAIYSVHRYLQTV